MLLHSSVLPTKLGPLVLLSLAEGLMPMPKCELKPGHMARADGAIARDAASLWQHVCRIHLVRPVVPMYFYQSEIHTKGLPSLKIIPFIELSECLPRCFVNAN